jgi:serine/threonine protein kinase
LLLLDEREFSSQVVFKHKSENIVRVFGVLRVNDPKEHFNHWVILSEFVNGGSLDKYLELSCVKNPLNKKFPKNPLTEIELMNYFGQLCYIFLVFFLLIIFSIRFKSNP